MYVSAQRPHARTRGGWPNSLNKEMQREGEQADTAAWFDESKSLRLFSRANKAAGALQRDSDYFCSLNGFFFPAALPSSRLPKGPSD
jgi:hypothetical protein